MDRGSSGCTSATEQVVLQVIAQEYIYIPSIPCLRNAKQLWELCHDDSRKHPWLPCAQGSSWGGRPPTKGCTLLLYVAGHYTVTCSSLSQRSKPFVQEQMSMNDIKIHCLCGYKWCQMLNVSDINENFDTRRINQLLLSATKSSGCIFSCMTGPPMCNHKKGKYILYWLYLYSSIISSLDA